MNRLILRFSVQMWFYWKYEIFTTWRKLVYVWNRKFFQVFRLSQHQNRPLVWPFNSSLSQNQKNYSRVHSFSFSTEPFHSKHFLQLCRILQCGFFLNSRQIFNSLDLSQLSRLFCSDMLVFFHYFQPCKIFKRTWFSR